MTTITKDSKLDFTSFSNIIDGKLAPTSQTRNAINPATKKPNWDVPIATSQDVDNAVAAARTAFKSWSKTPIDERAKILTAFSKGIEEYTEDFAKLLVTEQGKPYSLAMAEAGGASKSIAQTAQMKLPEEVAEETSEKKVFTRYTPLGVVVGIVPWNFPISTAVSKLAPAVLTGNTVIIKPSPFTPYTALKIVELAQKFFPPGVVQALSGDDGLGPMLVAHPGVDKISFTGSSATGKKIMESASKTLKRVTLELGGNDAAIVCKSVDVQTAAPAVATLAFLNSGQICLALKRIYIHESIFPEFRDAMVAYTKTLKVGEGNEEGVFLGPIQNSMQYEKVQSFFDDIEKDGLKVVVGGKVGESKGYFINPTIIGRPAEDSRLVVEEPFGPILPILSWSDEDEVIARANNTKMGLGASVWSSDMDEAERIAKQLEAGNVWVNSHMEISPLHPFGGHKESGIGHEGGVSGLIAYCNAQALHFKKPKV